MPKRAVAFIIGVAAFLAIVLGIAAWAAFGDGAGQQRGLVLFNSTLEIVTVSLENGQERIITPDDEATFVIRREQFPSAITVRREDGSVLLEREFEYAYFAAADFRVSFDENGFYPTTEVRDTPMRGTPANGTPAPGD